MKSLMSGWCLTLCLILGLSLICNLRVDALCVDDDIEEYYWRHYNGKIPRDALLGGQDEEGNPTYIGQTMYNSILIPGYINEAQQQMYFEWGDSEHTTKENIKILCTQHPEQFEWIRTNVFDVASLPEKSHVNFVYGGFELSYTVYIGRLQVNEELAIGKVIVTDGRARGFHTTSNGTFIRAEKFEVLNYDPDIPKIHEIRKSLSARALYANSVDKVQSRLCSFVIVFCFWFFR